MSELGRVFVSTLLISVPEEIIWVSLVFIFLKRYDLLDGYCWKDCVKWILIPAIPQQFQPIVQKLK